LLQQYYKLGYGYAINKDISCPLISHIFQQMDEQITTNRLEKHTACIIVFKLQNIRIAVRNYDFFEPGPQISHLDWLYGIDKVK